MRLTGLIAMMALAFASCSKPTTTEQSPAPGAENPTATAPPPATPAPATPAPAETISQTPPAPAPSDPTPAPAAAVELAPEGVFYLLAAARVETADGVHGLPAGTGVKLVRTGVYLTPAGELPLDAAILTNDMTKARAARDSAQAAQAALAQRGAADAAKAAEMARAAAAATPTPEAPGLTQTARTPKARYVDGVTNSGTTMLQSSTSLGAAHTKTDDGWVWQKSPDGQWWVPVKRTDGTVPPYKPSRRAAK